MTHPYVPRPATKEPGYFTAGFTEQTTSDVEASRFEELDDDDDGERSVVGQVNAKAGTSGGIPMSVDKD